MARFYLGRIDNSRKINSLVAIPQRSAKLVEPGELDPNTIHVPGVYVHRVVALTPEQAGDKRIEKRTVRL